jgi:hypothetical protein
MKEELYRKIYIKSEADLPKEGDYMAHPKDTYIKNTCVAYFDPKMLSRIKDWMIQYDWYLQPIEQSEIIKALSGEKIEDVKTVTSTEYQSESKTSESIFYIEEAQRCLKHQDIDNATHWIGRFMEEYRQQPKQEESKKP